MRKILCGALFLGAVAIFAAYPTEAEKGAAPSTRKAEEGLKELVQAREQFGREALRDWRKIARFILVIAGAAALGAVIAYHPSSGRRAARDDLEQPKTIITYTVVGSLVAIVVAPIPAMAFAIFGIGGLMRFRTILGAAKETGRVILATVIGLMCGLEFWMAAILGTALAWIVIFLLESRLSMRLVIRGVKGETIAQTAEAYAQILKGLKCRASNPRKNPSKGQVAFNLQVPRSLGQEEIEARCNEGIPEELRGTMDWPED
jgi:hypothetical protein